MFNSLLSAKVWPELAEDLLVKVFMYSAIALAVILVGVGLFIWFKRREKFAGFLKGAICIAVGFAVAVILAMFVLEFAKIKEKDYFSWATNMRNFVLIPSAVLGGIVVLCVIAVYLSGLISKRARKISLIVSAAVIGAMIIAFLVCLGVYYAKGDAEANNGARVTFNESLGLYLSAVGIIAVITLLAIFLGRGEKLDFDSKAIAYASICIALSFALSYIKFISLPQGGSLTLASLLPLMVFSYMFGVRKGVMAGFIYGILQAVQELWFIHPAQFLLDYPIAFAAIGLAGMFAKIRALDKVPQVKFTLGAIVASVLRYASHVLSGVFAFSEFAADKGMELLPYSLGYNAFVFPDIAIAIAVGVILFSSKAFVKQVSSVQSPTKPAAPEEENPDIS